MPEVEEVEEKKPQSGGKGNLRLPYGLCERYGITLPDGATPRQAWDALAGEGISPDDVYKAFQHNKLTPEDGLKELDEIKGDINSDYSNNFYESLSVYCEDSNLEITEANKKVLKTIAKIYGKYKRLSKLFTITQEKLNGAYAEASGINLYIDEEFLKNPHKAFEKSMSYYTEEKKKEAKKELKKYQNFTQNKDPVIDAIKSNCQDTINFNRFNVTYENQEIETTIMHEMGHIIADQFFGMINGDKICQKPIWIQIERNDTVEDTFDYAKDSGDIYKISKYASTNKYEFFAECFAIKMMGKEKLPDYINEMLEYCTGE